VGLRLRAAAAECGRPGREYAPRPARVDVAGQWVAPLDEEFDQGPFVAHGYPRFVRLDVGDQFFGHLDTCEYWIRTESFSVACPRSAAGRSPPSSPPGRCRRG